MVTGNVMTQLRTRHLHVGVLALQGAFMEHLELLNRAFKEIKDQQSLRLIEWSCGEVRTAQQLAKCDALIIPGGESTTIALVAERSGLLEPLRDFIKVARKPVWGTCAGLIMMSEAANRTKEGGQELLGGIDVRVNRNHFGRQVESFERDMELPFLKDISSNQGSTVFKGVFIRAPVVERILPHKDGIQDQEVAVPGTIVAPSRTGGAAVAQQEYPVEILATLANRTATLQESLKDVAGSAGDIVAVRQRNCFGTSFHPELTDDERIHVWWLQQILATP